MEVVENERAQKKQMAAIKIRSLGVNFKQKNFGYPYHTLISNRLARPKQEVTIRLVGPTLPDVGDVISYETLTMRIVSIKDGPRPSDGKHSMGGGVNNRI